MNTWKVLLVDSNHPVLHECLQQAGFTCDLFWDKSTEELISLLPEYDALVIRSKFTIDKTILEKSTHLKCIGRVGAGMENIDTAAASALGITCLSIPEGNRDAVGEHALGMLLMLLNKLKKADSEVRQGIWLRAENRGVELYNLTVAIIGFGHMGSAFAQKLSGMGCAILAFDKYKKNYAPSYVTECTMDEVFEKADIVSIHLPLNSETKYLVNINFIHSFKKPVYIINTARGACLNTQDLVNAIRNGKVTGACLDVLEYESTSFERLNAAELPEAYQFLISSDKVILTPHIAGWTHESNYKMSKGIAEKMIACFKEQKH